MGARNSLLRSLALWCQWHGYEQAGGLVANRRAMKQAVSMSLAERGLGIRRTNARMFGACAVLRCAHRASPGQCFLLKTLCINLKGDEAPNSKKLDRVV